MCSCCLPLFCKLCGFGHENMSEALIPRSWYRTALFPPRDVHFCKPQVKKLELVKLQDFTCASNLLKVQMHHVASISTLASFSLLGLTSPFCSSHWWSPARSSLQDSSQDPCQVPCQVLLLLGKLLGMLPIKTPEGAQCLILLLLFPGASGVTRIAAQGGSWSSGLTNYEVSCPIGSHISAFGGRSGDAIDAIGPFTCTNGQSLPLIGGSNGGNAWTHAAGNAGYTGLTIRAGTLVDQIRLLGTFGSSSYGLPRGVQVGTLQCPVGMVMAGVFGSRTTTNPIKIGLICRTKGKW